MQSRDLRRREAWVVVQVLDKYQTTLACLAVGSNEKRGSGHSPVGILPVHGLGWSGWTDS